MEGTEYSPERGRILKKTYNPLEFDNSGNGSRKSSPPRMSRSGSREVLKNKNPNISISK